MNSGYLNKIKSKENYFTLGRWVSPVLELELWTNWSGTKEAQALNLVADNPAIVLDGHYFMPKVGAYTALKEEMDKEFASGKFVVTEKILTLAESASDECLAMAKKVKTNPTFEDFLTALEVMKKIRFPWMSCFPIGEAAEGFVARYVSEHGLRMEDATGLIEQLPNSVNEDQKALSGFRGEIENAGLPFEISAIEARNPKLGAKLREYQKETEYIGTHHFWGEERTIERLLEAVKNATLPSEAAVHKNTGEEAFEIIARATKWRLECAQSSAALAYKFKPYMTEIAEKNGLTYDDLIFLLSSEIRELMNGRSDLLPIIRERQKAIGVLGVDGEIQIITGDELKNLEKHFGLLEEHAEVTEFKGAIGNKGIVRGKVAIVLKPTDQPKVLPGMILVAPETTPDLISSMGRAAAFVTDQGGITSHAAIVAREMKKPCVIGTKIATKVLKDGMEVEVDANKGVVRILG